MVDFSRLVLRPVMRSFARQITVTPLATQPGVPAYEARGVWSVRPVDIQTEGGAILSSAVKTLGVRLAEFAVAPDQGDRVTVDGVLYVIDDTDDDGQGGSLWTLKALDQP